MNMTMQTEILNMKKRRKLIKDHGIKVIKTNPDAAGVNINRLINQIYIHINELNKKQTEESTKKYFKKVFRVRI